MFIPNNNCNDVKKWQLKERLMCKYETGSVNASLFSSAYTTVILPLV